MTLEDITDRKRAEAEMQNTLTELKRQVDELKRSNEDLEQFALVAAHDLQSPLRTGLQFARLLERNYKEKLDTDAGYYLRVITGNLDRMRTLIGALLSYSQVSTVKDPVSTPTDSEAAVRLALTDLETVVTETGAVITHEDLPTVSVESTQLFQLFHNLIANGIRYRSTEPPRLHISAARQKDIWLFSLRDNGIGIEPQYFDQIFEPFKRLHGEERPGSGVGLAICKKIVQRYRGDIWVASEVGKGSTFHFTLPA